RHRARPYPFWATLAVIALPYFSYCIAARRPPHSRVPPPDSLAQGTIEPRMLPILLANIVNRALAPRNPPRAARTPARGGRRRGKRINLALQGGGAHGAFTWGVLDHLLEHGRIEIEGISGASAGALNALMLADGLSRGGPQEARTRLADFWRA